MREDMQQRMAVLPVGHPIMNDLLRLPEGYQVHTSFLMPDADAVGFVIRSAAFEPSPIGVYLPHMAIEMHRCDSCGGPMLHNVRYPVARDDIRFGRVDNLWHRTW